MRVMIRIFFVAITLSCIGLCANSINPKRFTSANALIHKFKESVPSFSFNGLELPDWMQEQIQEDVSHFKSHTTQDLLDFFQTTRMTLFHFKIRDGKVFVRCNQGYDSLMVYYAVAMQKIVDSSKRSIRNADFLLTNGDSAGNRVVPVPCFCFSKGARSNMIHIPDWFAINHPRIKVLSDVNRAFKQIPWSQRKNKAFFMGAINGAGLYSDRWRNNPRVRAIYFSRKFPKLAFVRFSRTSNNCWDSSSIYPEMKAHFKELTASRTSEYDACKFKYLLDIDGWSCGFHRGQWALRSGSVVIRQKSHQSQWYHKGLKPYHNMIPYTADCSDLEEIIRWLQENDDKARVIGKNGRKFSKKYLNTNMIFYYFYQVLLEVNKLNLDHN